MFDVDAFFYIKFFLLSACQERFQDVSIALEFLDQDTQVLHALAKKSSPRAVTRSCFSGSVREAYKSKLNLKINHIKAYTILDYFTHRSFSNN